MKRFIATALVCLWSGSLPVPAQAQPLAEHSTALGHFSIASGLNSLAAGDRLQADGEGSVALGLRALSGGAGSVVLGSDAATQSAASGSFVFGDRSTTSPIIGFAPNEFLVRAAGGVALCTNAALTTGLRLAPAGSRWLGLSDAKTEVRGSVRVH
ncbi:MAG: hypothetical protein AB7H81_18135 [Vicinamibacterales bacterium]